MLLMANLVMLTNNKSATHYEQHRGPAHVVVPEPAALYSSNQGTTGGCANCERPQTRLNSSCSVARMPVVIQCNTGGKQLKQLDISV